jgi:hypothetical protein
MDMEHNPERRQEKRQPQSGAIEISFADPVPVTVNGELIEVSGRGFRAAHNTKGLAPGLEVEYRSSSAAGHARVIWTHVLDGQCVSGFLTLPSAATSG